MSMPSVGSRLRDQRQRAGLSLRGIAKQIGVSPSLVSQIETGKTRPSVETLLALAQLLDISMDELLELQVDEDPQGISSRRLNMPAPGIAESSSDIKKRPTTVLHQQDRPRLELETGVIWERLAESAGLTFDFILISYPPHSASTLDGRMTRHSGREFGYLVEGELEVKVGFETFRVKRGDSIELDSSRPHVLTNPFDVEARGVWLDLYGF